MATIDSREFIDRIIAGNGRIDPEDAPDNPWVVKIVQYTNAEGRETWGVVFAGEERVPTANGSSFADRYEQPTEFVRNPEVIWRRRYADPHERPR